MFSETEDKEYTLTISLDGEEISRRKINAKSFDEMKSYFNPFEIREKIEELEEYIAEQHQRLSINDESELDIDMKLPMERVEELNRHIEEIKKQKR